MPCGGRPSDAIQVFACFEMWGKLGERKCTAAPVVVYAVYKSLGDIWNKVTEAGAELVCSHYCFQASLFPFRCCVPNVFFVCVFVCFVNLLAILVHLVPFFCVFVICWSILIVTTSSSSFLFYHHVVGFVVLLFSALSQPFNYMCRSPFSVLPPPTPGEPPPPPPPTGPSFTPRSLKGATPQQHRRQCMMTFLVLC